MWEPKIGKSRSSYLEDSAVVSPRLSPHSPFMAVMSNNPRAESCSSRSGDALQHRPRPKLTCTQVVGGGGGEGLATRTVSLDIHIPKDFGVYLPGTVALRRFVSHTVITWKSRILEPTRLSKRPMPYSLDLESWGMELQGGFHEPSLQRLRERQCWAEETSISVLLRQAVCQPKAGGMGRGARSEAWHQIATKYRGERQD